MRKNKQQSETEAALLKRALGFTQEEVYSEDIIDKNSGESTGLAKRKIIKKTVPPDVRALLFWLKNRYPDRWKDKISPPPEDIDYNFDEDEMNL
ncbi:MAG: hypothetical protein IKA22_02280 [Lentisphaeria bacterium]|nr:hypothetical protein [Lentisphaeria bacterium]